MRKDRPTGILRRMVRLVLPAGSGQGGPTTSESESELDQDSGKGRQLLRELMERRRRNDLVRQREFDQLRRMRRLAAVHVPVPADADEEDEAAESEGTEFLDTAPDHDPEERAMTVRKINEIEEQMSRQWWKTRPAEPVDLLPNSRPPGGESRRPGDSQAATRHVPLPGHSTLDIGPPGPRPSTGFITTTGSAQVQITRRAPVPPVQPDLELPDLELPDMELPGAAAGEPADTMIPQLVATGPGPLPGPQPALPGFVHDPQLEEAAIEFANGDAMAAQLHIRHLIDSPASTEGASLLEYWFALFDLYRALGRREAFEASAIEYAERFGRSPPAWVSLAPDALPPAEGLVEGTGDFHWHSPALVGAHAVSLLTTGAATAPGAWWLDWSGLEGFEYDAVAPLLEAFHAWSLAEVHLCFEGSDRLLAALESRTLTGAADAEADWWRLRMEALRLMGRIDDYEEAALDYCITYEVSPPAWQEPRCICQVLQGGMQPAFDHASVAFADDDAPQPPPLPELVGEIGSDIASVLARVGEARERQLLMAPMDRDELLAIDCSRLVRLDFVAAGSVLGWAAARHAEGLAVEFRHLHRLAGIFFNVTGINEYARVYVRPD
ncbi:STAS domain-containing protein [Xylophilus sp. GOD-11R]|uniref:STAS domain-containing protein n=1 Tax=Xylophilus sp. GOD-11R TaxID=3089814 RepID=UPI00298CE26D|nr:STAS domain-containing protein [Xylophilus sp. GOD-11R]WPB56241.1 STAS domain-containing protein [Xylophilus sp. GOD-11R]